MEILLLKGAVVVGQGMVGSAIGDLYTSIKRSSHHSEFSKLLRDLDIQYDLEIVEKLLHDVSHFKTSLHVIETCTSQIREIVVDIKKEIDAVNLKFIEYQYSNRYADKYYHYVARYIWNIGGPDYCTNSKRLKKLSARLRERVDILIKLIAMSRSPQDHKLRSSHRSTPSLEIPTSTDTLFQREFLPEEGTQDANMISSLYESAMSSSGWER